MASRKEPLTCTCHHQPELRYFPGLENQPSAEHSVAGLLSHTEGDSLGKSISLEPSPACLWGCWRLRWPWGLLPCCRKRAAPFTMKKLSLKLGRGKKNRAQLGWNSQRKMGEDKLQRKSWRVACERPTGWNSSYGSSTLLPPNSATSLLLESFGDKAGHLGYNTDGLHRLLQHSEPLPAGHCDGTHCNTMSSGNRDRLSDEQRLVPFVNFSDFCCWSSLSALNF